MGRARVRPLGPMHLQPRLVHGAQLACGRAARIARLHGPGKRVENRRAELFGRLPLRRVHGERLLVRGVHRIVAVRRPHLCAPAALVLFDREALHALESLGIVHGSSFLLMLQRLFDRAQHRLGLPLSLDKPPAMLFQGADRIEGGVVEQRLDLGKPHAGVAVEQNLLKALDVAFSVDPIPVRLARRRKQARLFVVMQRAHAHARGLGQLFHRAAHRRPPSSLHPRPLDRTDAKPSVATTHSLGHHAA